MTIPFFLNYALKMLILLMVRQAHHERNQRKPFVLDCMDAGGRATHEAVAESLSKDLFRASLIFI
jgi:hypothetical protein